MMDAVLYLEHPRLLRNLTVQRYLKDVGTVAIYEPYGEQFAGTYDVSPLNSLLDRNSTALMGLRVLRISHRSHFDEMIEAGEEAIELLEKNTEQMKANPVFQGLARLLGAQAVILCLKKGLVMHLKDRIHFFKTALALRAQISQRFILVPAFQDIFELETRYGVSDGDRWTILRLDGALRSREIWQKTKYLLLALAGVVVRLNSRTFKRWTPLRLTKPVERRVAWSRPINRGIVEKNEVKDGQYVSDDDLEDDDSFRPSQWLYELSFWRYGKEKEARWRKYLQAKGALVVDTWQLRMPVGFYLKVKIPASYARLWWTIQSFMHPSTAKLLEIAYPMVEAYVDSELILQYFLPTVYYACDDYQNSHIVRTVVFNRHGCKTIGIHHGSYSSLGLNPYIAFIYCNTYCTYGPVYFNRIWKGTWSYAERQAIIGVTRNDYTHQAFRNEERRAVLRKKYSARRLLLWCPPSIGLTVLNSMELIEEAFKALMDFKSAHPEWAIILHGRGPERVWYANFAARMGGSAQMASEDDFSTYELMAYVDAIVTANLSTVGIEAICAGRERVVFMNYWGDWNHPFRRYSPDLVVSSGAELSTLLRRWALGERGQSPASLEAFRRDFDVGFDGQALERFKTEMRALAGKVTS